MASKKTYLQKNKNNVYTLVMAAVIFLLLSLIVTGIGSTATSAAWWVSTVDFFNVVHTHFSANWMFYSVGLVVLFAYVGKK